MFEKVRADFVTFLVQRLEILLIVLLLPVEVPPTVTA